MEIDREDLRKRISEIENDPNVNLKVPVRLTDPDVSIIAAKREARNKETLRHGPSLINVTAKHADRALRIYDTIIKVFRARGHEFTGNNVVVDGQRYEITIREKFKKIDGSFYNQTPTGILCIKAYHYYPVIEIYDSKNILIEERIAKVVALLELEVEDLKRAWADNAKREKEREEQERIRLEHIGRQEKELTDFKRLLSSANRAFEANLIRKYIQSVESKAAQNESLTSDVQDWIKWASEKADWYDPLVEKEVELLKEVSKEALTNSISVD